METVLNIVSLLPLIIMAVCMFIAGLVGLIRGLKKTTGSLVVVVLSIVVSLIITLILCNPESGLINLLLTQVINPLLQSANLGDIANMSSVGTIIKYYAAMLIGPFLFAAIFYVIRTIFGIVMRIVVKHIPIMKNVPAVANRLGGLGVGLVVGFIVAVVTLMPLLGTVNVANVAVANLSGVIGSGEDAGDDQLYNTNYDYLTDASTGEKAEDVDAPNSSDEDELTAILIAIGNMSNKGAGKVILVLGGDALYTATSEQNYNGTKVNLETEITGITYLVTGITSLATDLESGNGFSEALAAIADATEASPLVALISSDCLSTAATNWSEGESFMGIEPISVDNELIQPLMDAILEAFAETDETSVTEDIRTVQGAVEVLEKYDVFNSMDDQEALVEILGSSPILSELESAFGENDKMASIGEEISNVTMKAFVSAIDIPKEGDEEYEDYIKLTDTIAKAVNDNAHLTIEEKRAKINEEIKKASEEYGVDVSEYNEVISYVTDKFLNEFGNRNDVTAKDIQNFIEQFATEK